MRRPSAVQNVGHRLINLRMFGLTGDRPFMPLIIERSGKSFICAHVDGHGGPGVAIAHPMILS